MTAHDDFSTYVLSLLPTAYWPFQGTSPAALADTSGNGHTLGTTGTPTFNTDIGNGFRAATLNGTTDYFTPASAGAFNANPFSAFALCRPTAGDTSVLSTESNAATLNGTGFGMIVGDAANNLALAIRLENTGTHTDTVDTKPYGNYGTGYVMIGATYDGVNQILWVNGVPVLARVNTIWTPGTVTLELGRFGGSAVKFFKGGLSDCGFFNRVLTSTEMLTLAQKAQYTAGATAVQLEASFGVVNSALTALSTALNRLSPPNLALLSIISSTTLTGVGTLSVAAARGIIVRDSIVPPTWGIHFGVVGRYENRMVQLEFIGTLFGGVTSVPLNLVDQHDAFALYLFDNNLPTSLNYDVAPGVTVAVDLLG